MKRILSLLVALFFPLLGMAQVAIPVTDLSFTATNKIAGRSSAGAGAGQELSQDTALGVVGGGAGGFGFRNRITNGANRVSQAKAGTSTTASTFGNLLITDKWRINLATSCASSVVQQVTDAPTGFSYSYKFTVGTGSAPGSGDFNQIQQIVEGPEIADFNFGTANAVVATLSFWVKSSVTGTYSVAFDNATARTYLAQYTVNSASTWEQKTATFTMDTSGTWLTAAGTTGCRVTFDIGSGSTTEGTASVWQAGVLRRVSTNVKLVATSSATFQVTGVQWERGSLVTAYEQIPYQVELARCQRYYDTSIEAGATTTNFTTLNASGVGGVMAVAEAASGDLFPNVRYHVPMASSPTLTVYSGANRTAGSVRAMNTGTDVTGFANGASTSSNTGFGYIAGNTLAAGIVYGFHYVADTGL